VTIPPGAVPDGSGIECGEFDPGFAPQSAPAGALLKRTLAINIWGPSNAFITAFSGRVPTVCYPYTSDDVRRAGGRADRLGVVNAEVNGAYRSVRSTLNTATRQVCVAAQTMGLFDVVAGDTSVSGSVTQGGGDYVVRAGDTLFLISLRFRTTVAALRAANGIVGDRIDVGQRLIIPNFSPGAPAPSATPAPAPTASAGQGGQTYRVQRGDTLYTIALRFGTTVSALQAANALVGSRILAGQILTVPNQAPAPTPAAPVPAQPTPAPTATTQAGTTGRTHIVQRGENLFRIGLRYGTTAAALRAANGLNGNLIYVGQVLVIP
jgi:LysM repeat protein